MATDRCRIDQMAHVIMEGLQEYADLATEDMKAAVKKAGNKAKREVQAGAPVVGRRIEGEANSELFF